jgi:DUF4097 and DUF4098 domain-containing protein YvlB
MRARLVLAGIGFAAAAAVTSSSAAAPAPAARAGSNVLERTVRVPQGARFVLDTDAGAVRVRGGSRADARLVATAASNVDLEAKATVEVRESADEVRIVFRRKKGPRSSWFGLFGGGSTTQVKFEVEVPARTPVRIETGGGPVDAAALRADASLRTSGGPIRVGDHQGRLSAETSGGSIGLEHVRGDATVRTSGGHIEAREIHGALQAVTSGGAIEVVRISGDLRAVTSGGPIRIQDAAGRVQAETSGGSVQASFARGNAKGGSLESSAGSVRVSIDPAVDLTIEASSSAGAVHAGLPVRGTVSRSAVRGTIGKGGSLLRLETSAGSIDIDPL